MNKFKLICGLFLVIYTGISNAQDFIMGDMQVVNRHGEKLYAQIPLTGMSPDGYSTLSGQVVGFDDRVDYLDFSFKSKGAQIYFVITSSKSLSSELAVQVFLSYKGVEKNAEYIIQPPEPPVVDVPVSISSGGAPAPDIFVEHQYSSVDEEMYIEFTKQAAIRSNGQIILPFRYQVQSGDSISKIIDRHINPYNAGFHRSVVTMYQHNLSAFDNGDINSLIEGSILKVPNIERFFDINRSQARRDYVALLNGENVPALRQANEPQDVELASQDQTGETRVDPAQLLEMAESLNVSLAKLNAAKMEIEKQIQENNEKLLKVEQMLGQNLAKVN